MSENSEIVSLEYALGDWILNGYPRSVINGEVIAKKIFELYRGKIYEGQRIARIRSIEPRTEVYRSHISSLTSAGIISRIPDFNSPQSARYPFDGSYIIKSKPSYTAMEAACSIFPHSYLSYLSAMARHGFTDKNPVVVYLSSPSKSVWREQEDLRLDDLVLDPSSSFRKPQFAAKYPTGNRIFDMEIHPVSGAEDSGVMEVRNSPLKLTTPARTLVDMTRKPSFCGGVEHSLESFVENAQPYKKQIFSYLGSYGKKIDRARVGFLLHRVLGMDDPTVLEWMDESSKTRGSSKILVPGEPFSEDYDENWCLSINASIFKRYRVS